LGALQSTALAPTNEELKRLVACSALSESFLTSQGLTSYVEAARTAHNNTRPILESLTALQKEKEGNDPAKTTWCSRFACILLSSGAGKTQLAATAALNSPSTTKVIYLCLDEGDPAFSQQFYRPHRKLADKLIESLKDIRSKLPSDMDFSSTILSASRDGKLGADKLAIRLISMILFQDVCNDLCTMRRRVFDCRTTFLVFIDEVTGRGDVAQDEAYAIAMVLRNLFRAIGIAPILMGTHLAACNAVGSTSREDVAEVDQGWVVVVTQLPRYTLTAAQKNAYAFLHETDRPLVLHWALEDLAGQSMNATTVATPLDRLRHVVAHVRGRLQRAKTSAWDVKSGCQLLQLFRLEEINKDSFDNAHALMGGHFGKLVFNQVHNFDRRGIREEMESASMYLVSPQKEPLLHLALVTWDCSMLGKQRVGNFFPLAVSGQAVSVREAFELNTKRYTFQGTIDNPPAKKLCGDKLEVVVLAALSLASMKTDSKGFLEGVPLFDYITCSAVLMKKEAKLNPGAFSVDERFWSRIVQIPAFADMLIPAFGACDSPLRDSLKTIRAKIGKLARPADSVNVDGLADASGVPRSPLFQVECKNYTAGVGQAVCDNIFVRIKQQHSVALVFVSSLQDEIYSKSKWDTVRKSGRKPFQHDAFSKDTVSIAIIDVRGTALDLKWMKIGSVEICKDASTELLVVIFQVGKVE
jgi:hypothetical protein